MVPVIKNSHNMTLLEMIKNITHVSTAARSAQLTPSDTREGTVTLTNFGVSGIMMGVPIIRYPEVAIVGMGAIQKKVVALDDNTIGIRSMIHLSLTFDHRVVDGMYGCAFLNRIKNFLEKEPPSLDL